MDKKTGKPVEFRAGQQPGNPPMAQPMAQPVLNDLQLLALMASLSPNDPVTAVDYAERTLLETISRDVRHKMLHQVDPDKNCFYCNFRKAVSAITDEAKILMMAQQKAAGIVQP